MGAKIAGIYGAQIFRADDRPRYRHGFSINIAVLAVGLSLAVVRFVDDRLLRRRCVVDESEFESDSLKCEGEADRNSKSQSQPVVTESGDKGAVSS